jgi:hypothetical protein
MTTFEISNQTSGYVLGTYEGATEMDALNALARDAGYDNWEASVLADTYDDDAPRDIAARLRDARADLLLVEVQ